MMKTESEIGKELADWERLIKSRYHERRANDGSVCDRIAGWVLVPSYPNQAARYTAAHEAWMHALSPPQPRRNDEA